MLDHILFDLRPASATQRANATLNLIRASLQPRIINTCPLISSECVGAVKRDLAIIHRDHETGQPDTPSAAECVRRICAWFLVWYF
jgi:hypothetical protein